MRARFTLADVMPKPCGGLLVRYWVDVKIENEGKPALSADWLTMLVFDDNPS